MILMIEGRDGFFDVDGRKFIFVIEKKKLYFEFPQTNCWNFRYIFYSSFESFHESVLYYAVDPSFIQKTKYREYNLIIIQKTRKLTK